MQEYGFRLPDPDDLRLRTMNTDEARGFRFACQSLQIWAAQIDANSKGLSNSGRTVPLDQMMSHGAKMTKGLAEALERQSHMHQVTGQPAPLHFPAAVFKSCRGSRRAGQ